MGKPRKDTTGNVLALACLIPFVLRAEALLSGRDIRHSRRTLGIGTSSSAYNPGFGRVEGPTPPTNVAPSSTAQQAVMSIPIAGDVPPGVEVRPLAGTHSFHFH